MKHDLDGRPSYGLARIRLQEREGLLTRRPSIIARSTALEIRPTRSEPSPSTGFVSRLWGLVQTLVQRRIFGRVCHYEARRDDQLLVLAPPTSGSLEALPHSPHPIRLRAGAWFAATPERQSHWCWAGFGLLLTPMGPFFQEFDAAADSPDSLLLIHTHGALETIDIDGSYLLDGRRLVALSGPLNCRRRLVRRGRLWPPSWRWLVECTGTGRIWMETRELPSTLHRLAIRQPSH